MVPGANYNTIFIPTMNNRCTTVRAERRMRHTVNEDIRARLPRRPAGAPVRRYEQKYNQDVYKQI